MGPSDKGALIVISKKLFLGRTALSTGAFSLALGFALATPAMAQDATGTATAAAEAEGLEDIVVTGSRIARSDIGSAAPVTVVNAEEFALTGAVNVEQVLNTIPQILPGLTGFSNNPGNGAVTLNLRGLGEVRTLVLVNNRRYMFYDTNQLVDLNTIPQFLIAGVDVVTGGASAVYGSDAVSGVVNFRLRNNLEGIEVGGLYAVTEQGDGARYSFDAALGTNFPDNRGNVTVFANYTRRQSVFAGERSRSAVAAGGGCIVPGTRNADTSLGTPFPSGIALGTCLARGGEIAYVPQGSPTGPIGTFVSGTNTFIFNPTGGGSRTFQDPGDLYNFGAVNYLQVPQERYLLGGYANYELTDGVEAYAELTYVNNRVSTELAPTPTGVTAQLQIASPFFNEQTRALLLANDAAETTPATRGDGYAATALSYRFLSAGPRNQTATRQAFRVLGGLRGDITDKLRYDVFYSYARTANTQFQQGNVARSRYTAALSTEFVPGSTTQLRCRDAAARAAGCVPINVFGSGLADPAAVSYVRLNSTNLEEADLKNVVASVSGTLFNLGMGAEDVGFAAGYEYRGVSASFTPDTFLSSGDVLGFNAGLPTSGGYTVNEGFAELRVPVIRDGFIYSLELNGAGRYSKYSLDAVGGTYTYTGGVELSPIRDIKLRGQFARAVRAPNVQNLFGGASTGFPGAIDPCSDRSPTTQSDTLRAFCISAGVPAATVFTRAVQPAGQIQANFGGNPDVAEETSDTYTFGVVLNPSFVPRLGISVDYFNIKVDGTIATAFGGLDSALGLCFNTVRDLTAPVCQIFQGQRNPSNGALGETAGGRNPQILSDNVGRLATSGIDVNVNYNVPLFAGKLSLQYLGTWLDKYRSTPIALIPERFNILEGTFGLPKYRHNARATFAQGPFQISGRWRFEGKTKNSLIDNVFDGIRRTPRDPATLARPTLKAFNYFDLTATAEVSDRVTFNVGVNNMLNKKFPVIGQGPDGGEQSNTLPSFFDVLGRDFFVSARVKF